MMSSTPKRARRGLHLDTFVSTPRTTINQRQTSISRNSQREVAESPEVLNELLSVCKGILSRLTAIENLQREQHLQHHASGMSSVRSTPATISSPTLTTTTGSTEEIEDLFVVPDDLVQFCERSRQISRTLRDCDNEKNIQRVNVRTETALEQEASSPLILLNLV